MNILKTGKLLAAMTALFMRGRLCHWRAAMLIALLLPSGPMRMLGRT